MFFCFGTFFWRAVLWFRYWYIIPICYSSPIYILVNYYREWLNKHTAADSVARRMTPLFVSMHPVAMVVCEQCRQVNPTSHWVCAKAMWTPWVVNGCCQQLGGGQHDLWSPVARIHIGICVQFDASVITSHAVMLEGVHSGGSAM